MLWYEVPDKFQLKINMKFLHSQSHTNAQQGFSLVEMIVSLGLFAIVSVVALGAFIKVIDSNKKAQTLKTAINNLNFTLESMSREMRVGSQYYCGNIESGNAGTVSTDITSACTGGTYLMFRSSQGSGCNLVYSYRLSPTDSSGRVNGTIQKAEQKSCGGPLVYDDVTAKDINITSGSFNVIIGSGLGTQPYAQIYLKGTSGAKVSSQTQFTLQTTISPRLMNN